MGPGATSRTGGGSRRPLPRRHPSGCTARPAREAPARPEATGWKPILATVVIAVAIAVLAAGGVAGLVVVGGRDEKASGRKNEYPSAWDPRVTDLVAFVERERGLRFEHPVAIDFLDEATKATSGCSRCW